MSDIGWAFDQMKAGKKVRRSAWDSKFIQILVPGENSKMTDNYVYVTTNDRSVPFVFSHNELLATDWQSA